jgi:2-phosphosulfolactate phosphatase
VREFSEWGLEGVRSLKVRVAVLVIVDVMSFSTAVDVATSRGASVIPFRHGDPRAAQSVAREQGAELAGPRSDPSAQFSLSPTSLLMLRRGARLVLPSPNGSAISAETQGRVTFAGCLRNARAVAHAAILAANGGDIAVIPAGERWPDGSLRPAIEDIIGAGAILGEMQATLSPEAEIAVSAYQYAKPRLLEMLQGSVSGRYLTERGFPQDVEIACALNASTAAPELRDGAYALQTPSAG